MNAAPNFTLATPACFVPLFKLQPDNEAEPFKLHGTGFLVVYKKLPLLVTAAHVVDEVNRGLGVLLTTDWRIHALPEAFVKSPIPHGGNRADDFVDVAVIRLPPEIAMGISAEHFGFYYLATIPNCSVGPGEQLKFMGFPAQAQRDRSYVCHLHDGAQIVLSPRGLNSPLLPHASYPAQELLTPNFCYVSPYMNPRTRKEGEAAEAPFMPAGMSGGPIFVVRDNTAHLVGVISNWGSKEGYFIGTRLDYVANLLEQAVT